MRKLAISLIVGLACALPMGAIAQQPYYEGKTVTLLIGWPTGGGTDLFGRVFVEKLREHIPGNPTVVVENRPGAASVTALNHFVSTSPRDGSVVFVGTGNILLRIMMGADRTDAKVSDLRPLVSGPMGRVTYISPNTGINSAADLADVTDPLILGVIEPLSTLQPSLQFEMLGIPVRTVMGYPGKADTRLAFERGEIDIDEQTTPVYQRNVAALVESGQAVPLFSQGLMAGDQLARDPAAPDVPTIAEVYEQLNGTEPSGPIWEAYKAVVTAYGNGGKILMVHHDIPEEALAELQFGLSNMLEDPEFLAQAEALLEGYDLAMGDDLEAIVADIANMSQDSIDWLKTFLFEEFQLTFANN